MSRHQRLNDILTLLSERGHLQVEDIVDELDVSAATVRRDFDHLAAQQLLTRTHGGAVSTASSYDLPLRYKIARSADAKLAIARAAAAMVTPGSSIGLNGGTTTNEVARALVSRPDLVPDASGISLTVVTNALNIATELAVRPQIKIVVVGGVARPQSYELIGPLASSIISQVNVDIVFLGVDAVTPKAGAMCRHEGEASVSRELAARSQRVVVVADSSKFSATAFARICGSSDIDVLLTDVDPGDATRKAFEDSGVEVRVAG